MKSCFKLFIVVLSCLFLYTSCATYKEIPYNESLFERNVLLYEINLKSNIQSFYDFKKIQKKHFVESRYIFQYDYYIMIPIYNYDLLNNRQAKHLREYVVVGNDLYMEL